MPATGAKQEEIVSRSVKQAGYGAIFLSLLGLANASVLLREHYLFHTDSVYQSFCDLNESFTCKGVALSDWSVLLGLPVAAWGVMGTLLLFSLGIWVVRRASFHDRSAAGLLLLISAGAVCSSIGLTIISLFFIGALCPLCLLSHLINFTIAFLSLRLALRLGGCWSAIQSGIGTLIERPVHFAVPALAMLIAIFGFRLGVPKYWTHDLAKRTDGLSTGITAEGSPWIGAKDPEICITEYSDYQCPHCRRGHQEVRKLVSENPGKVRLVHCQFPLDRSCNESIGRTLHDRACDLASYAICAGEQGKFWEANDFLFDCENKEELTAAAFSEALKIDQGALQRCLESPKPVDVLKRDLQAGISLGVRGTPSFLVKGQLYPGRIPPEVLGATRPGNGG